MSKKYYIMDSYEVNPSYVDMIEELKLEKHFTSIDGAWSPNFVGFILTENETIISFPKHYCSTEFEIKNEDLLLIKRLLLNSRHVAGLNDELENHNNFPLTSYLYVCNYYRKYGLYVKREQKREVGYNGRINWKSTMNKSNKLISGNNLLFLPFIIDKNISLDVFITECMVYTMHEGFNRFGQYFELGININKTNNNPIFKRKELVIKQLNLLKADYFKDSERILIDHLINYFNWSNNNGDLTTLITNNFEGYWETMVEHYLNSNLDRVEPFGGFSFKENVNRFSFKKELEYIEKLEVRKSGLSRNFSVEYDHLYIDANYIAYLFDSKYYKNINSLDYKQLSYYFILKQSRKYYNKVIINGLILPTEKDYSFRIHIDTRNNDGLLKGMLIIEHYLNVKNVIESYIEKKV